MSYQSKVSLTFAGCGGFFADQSQYQSNFVITSEAPGKEPRRLLFDCGTDAKFSLPELGLDASSFEAVYISHQHGDHAGGLEWMGFYTYFTGKPKPKLVCNHGLMGELWEHGLRGPMSTLRSTLTATPCQTEGGFTGPESSSGRSRPSTSSPGSTSSTATDSSSGLHPCAARQTRQSFLATRGTTTSSSATRRTCQRCLTVSRLKPQGFS
jgi:ribonuclease BN (tRNA processing enzyme)